MTKALVTGGGGFLGTHLCQLLTEQGFEVYSFSRSHYDHLDKMKVKQIQGDLSSLESVTSALSGMEVVFHVASLAGFWGAYEKYFQTNIMGAQNILDACQKLKIEYLIYTSTPSVAYQKGGIEGVDESIGYSKTFESYYAQTKATAEKMILNMASQSFKIVSLRPHLIWGPGDHHFLPRLISRARSGKLKLIGDGSALVDHTYVKNAAQAHLDAYHSLQQNPESCNGKAYFLSQDEPIKIKDLINNIFLNVAKIQPISKKIPFKVAYFIGAFLEVVYKVFRLKGEPMMTKFVAEQLATPHWFDITAAKKDLNYNVKISTETGIVELKDWYEQVKPI